MISLSGFGRFCYISFSFLSLFLYLDIDRSLSLSLISLVRVLCGKLGLSFVFVGLFSRLIPELI